MEMPVRIPIFRLRAAAAVCAWLGSGTIFYRYINNCSFKSLCTFSGTIVSLKSDCDWTWEMSFYYTVQSGLSIGFGLLAESRDESRFYTILSILAGSSLIGGALSFFMSSVFHKQQEWQSEQEKILAKFALQKGCNGYAGMDPQQAVDVFSEYPQHLNNLYNDLGMKEDVIKKNMAVFRSGSPAQKRAMAHEAMGKAAETIDSFKDQSVSIADLTELQQRAMGPLGKVKKHVRDNLRGYQMFTFLVVWISVGALFFCVRCDKSFIQGVYFSVATMSTAGLQAVCFDRDDPSTSGNLIFAAFFSLSGVPLYAMALGTFASQLLEGHQKRLQAEKMGAKINEGEIAFVQNLLGTGDDEQADSIEFAEYIQIQLLRLGVVDADSLKDLRASFDRLDVDHSGSISREELMNISKGTINRVRELTAIDVAVSQPSPSSSRDLSQDSPRSVKKERQPKDQAEPPETSL
mmetsp:Transcript_8634/g.13698  ORF Transcript_8634/g.13698 Transcript_8634/m.13698 type:complete len:462 (-) Transcript_8634:127-1512(-)